MRIATDDPRALALPKPGDPEYGFRCPECHAACSMPNTSFIECVSPYCDWNSES